MTIRVNTVKSPRGCRQLGSAASCEQWEPRNSSSLSTLLKEPNHCLSSCHTVRGVHQSQLGAPPSRWRAGPVAGLHVGIDE